MAVITADTFDPLRSYIGSAQQGVPLVDADWNEAHDVRKFEVQAFLKWFVGNGVPEGNDGFRIEGLVPAVVRNFVIGEVSARHPTERITWSGGYGMSGDAWWMGWTSSSPRTSTFAPSRCISARWSCHSAGDRLGVPTIAGCRTSPALWWPTSMCGNDS